MFGAFESDLGFVEERFDGLVAGMMFFGGVERGDCGVVGVGVEVDLCLVEEAVEGVRV